jgi:hypothetical protein
MLNVAVPPAETVAVVGDAEMEKSGGAKFPTRGNVRGLPGALSLIVTVPLLVPEAVGLKVTLMAQLPPAAITPPPQVLVRAKSPFAAMLVMVKLPSPLFVSVTVCGGLVVLMGCWSKDKLAGDVITAGPGIVTSIFDTKALLKPLRMLVADSRSES